MIIIYYYYILLYYYKVCLKSLLGLYTRSHTHTHAHTTWICKLLVKNWATTPLHNSVTKCNNLYNFKESFLNIKYAFFLAEI